MESQIATSIPIQMIACTDTDGKITPLRFRFKNSEGEIVSVNIEHIISIGTLARNLGASFVCCSTIDGIQKQYELFLSAFTGKWIISKIGR